MEMVPMMYASQPRCSVTNAFMAQLNSFRHSFSQLLSPQNLLAASRTNCTGEVSEGRGFGGEISAGAGVDNTRGVG